MTASIATGRQCYVGSGNGAVELTAGFTDCCFGSLCSQLDRAAIGGHALLDIGLRRGVRHDTMTVSGDGLWNEDDFKGVRLIQHKSGTGWALRCSKELEEGSNRSHPFCMATMSFISSLARNMGQEILTKTTDIQTYSAQKL